MSTLILNLSNDEIDLLRDIVSKLGTSNRKSVTLQLKIANAILDSDYLRTPIQQIPYDENFLHESSRCINEKNNVMSNKNNNNLYPYGK